MQFLVEKKHNSKIICNFATTQTKVYFSKQHPIQTTHYMKRTLHILIFIAFASIAHAQIKLGIKAGVNTSEAVFGSAMFESDWHRGVYIGGIVQFKLPMTGLYLDTSLLYETRKVIMENSVDANVERSTLKYLTLPINMKLGLGLASVIGIYVSMGPQFTFNMGDKKIWENNYNIKQTQFSWNLGAGVQIFHKLQVGYNYNIAISPTAEVEVKNLYTSIRDSKVKDNIHQVYITYFF